jgi:stress-induced morphogen
MVSPEEIRRCIEAALPGATAVVADSTGAGDHFEAHVRAPGFAGKTLVEQHQLVYTALGGMMSRIHALSLQTEAQ